jgi:hypothetical protein
MSTHSERVWPGNEWQTAELDEVGIDRVKLAEAAHYQVDLSKSSDSRPYRILIARHGKIAAEWNFRTDPLA